VRATGGPLGALDGAGCFGEGDAELGVVSVGVEPHAAQTTNAQP
jgi:hypothetical protein